MKLPDKAKKVFSGVIHDVYQWDQELFDGSTAVFERLTRPDSVCIVPIIDGKIFLSHEKQADWDEYATGLVSGRVEKGEAPLETAKRELLEETGFVSSDWDLLFTHNPSTKIRWTIHTYVARNCGKQQEPAPDPGEKITLRSVTFDELMELALKKGFRSPDFTFNLLRLRYANKLDDFKKKLNLI